MKYIDLWDWLLLPIYLFIIFTIALFIRNKHRDKSEYKYFLWGLSAKIIGGIAFALVYVYYYGGGDTIYYFTGGRTLTQILFDSPSTYLKLMFATSEDVTNNYSWVKDQIVFAKAQEEWFMVKIMSVINLFTFNKYLISTILTSLLSFYGGWKMMQGFIFFFPREHKISFISVFLVPTVIFWGGGILKDTVTFAFLCFLLYHAIKLFFKYEISLKSILYIALSSYVILTLKGYILFSFIPPMFFAWYIYNQNRIKSKFFRILLTPFLIVIALGASTFLIQTITSQSKKYNVEGLESRLKGFHSWHTTQGGSTYNLGEMDYTPMGVIKKLPAALNVTFFRPYLWEARNIVNILGSLESLLFFILFVSIFIRYRLKWIKQSFSNPLLAMAIIYCIIFGFAVGFTSYNFGALARYKIPCLPFFAFLLLYFTYSQHEKDLKEDRLND